MGFLVLLVLRLDVLTVTLQIVYLAVMVTFCLEVLVFFAHLQFLDVVDALQTQPVWNVVLCSI